MTSPSPSHPKREKQTRLLPVPYLISMTSSEQKFEYLNAIFYFTIWMKKFKKSVSLVEEAIEMCRSNSKDLKTLEEVADLLKSVVKIFEEREAELAKSLNIDCSKERDSGIMGFEEPTSSDPKLKKVDEAVILEFLSKCYKNTEQNISTIDSFIKMCDPENPKLRTLEMVKNNLERILETIRNPETMEKSLKRKIEVEEEEKEIPEEIGTEEDVISPEELYKKAKIEELLQELGTKIPHELLENIQEAVAFGTGPLGRPQYHISGQLKRMADSEKVLLYRIYYNTHFLPLCDVISAQPSKIPKSCRLQSCSV